MGLSVDRTVESAVRWDRVLLAAFGCVLLATLIGLWAARAFTDPSSYDTGLAYLGGRAAWLSGHPERLDSWISTPFLAVVMALVTRLWSASTAGTLVTATNVALVIATVALVVRGLRGVLSTAWLWAVAAALVTFVPMMSTVWWKQFNMIVLALALAGFVMVRRQRSHAGGALIGLSISIKPLLLLLPFVLLARRGTRAAGYWALGYVAALNVGAQWLMAAHAHDASALDPLIGIRNFIDKSKADFICKDQNYSPQATLCRIAGSHALTIQRLLVVGAVAVLVVYVVKVLRRRDTSSWESFAFTCAISAMVSPIAWSHYQLMLAPLFVLLVVRFSTQGAARLEWAGLAAAFALASLVWEPYGTVIDVVKGGLRPGAWIIVRPVVTDFAQASQYVLLATALAWYARRDRLAPVGALEQRQLRGGTPRPDW